MIELTEDYWKDIMSGGNAKGLKFENLVEDLLKEMFPSLSWGRTKQTRDGKKDFTISIPIPGIGGSNTFWVECKNHSDRISIDTLSPTLVMATIEKTQGIYFFSYSAINRPANQYLSQFANIVDKTIIPFDDSKLESLILKHDAIVKKYFPQYTKSESFLYAEKKQITCSVRFTRDLVYSHKGSTILNEFRPGEKVLQVNETFGLDIFIENPNSETKEITLKLEPEEFLHHFSLLDSDLEKGNYSLKLSVNPYQTLFKRLAFRFERYTEKIHLPNIYLFENGKQIVKVTLGAVSGNWIISAPLVGGRYLELRDRVRKITAHRNALTTHCLYGESGTGKSRLVKEFKDVLLANGYKICSEDGDFQNEKSTGLRLLRKIVSELSGLPQKEFLFANLQGSIEANMDSEILRSPVTDLLYSDSFSLRDRLEEASALLLHLCKGNPTAIIIDNVQYYDEDLMLFLNIVLSKYDVSNIPLTFILSFNTDYLFTETKAYQLLEKIKDLSRTTANQFYHFEVNGFSREESKQFIEHCIPGIGRLYPNTMSYLMEKVGDIPLYLEQTLHFLADNCVLEKRGDYFVLSDIEKFHSGINSLPNQIYDLINLRWGFLAKTTSGTVFESILKQVTLFQKIPTQLMLEFGFAERHLQDLINLGILERTVDGQMAFHHSQIRQYFDSIFFSFGVDKVTAEMSVRVIEVHALQSTYPAQYFISKNQLDPYNKEIIAFGGKCLLNDEVSQEHRVRFAKQLYTSLSIPSDLGDLPVIKIYTKICDDIKTYEQFSSALGLFTEVYDQKLKYYKRYTDNGQDYYYFIFRYVNSFLSTHQDAKAHKVLLKALKSIDEFYFISERDKKKAKAALLNRLCVTYKSLNYPELAEAAADESLQLSHEINDLVLTTKNYIDKGYVYYKDIGKLEKLIYCWDQAWNIFCNEYSVSLETRRVSAYYHKSLIELVKNNRRDSLHYAKEALKAAERDLDIFNKIKIQIVLCIIHYLEKSKSNEEIEALIRETIDLSVRNSSIRSYWTSWHALGKMCRDSEEKKHSYLTSLELLEKFIVNEKMESLYLYFFEDLAITLHRLRFNSPDIIRHITQRIKSKQIKIRISEIMTMKDADFLDFLAAFQPITPITDGRTNFPCP